MRLPSPATWARIHAGLSVFWLLLTIPAVTIWRDSVPFLVSISMAALVLGSIASWTAAKGDSNSPTVEHVDRLERKIDLLILQSALGVDAGTAPPTGADGAA